MRRTETNATRSRRKRAVIADSGQRRREAVRARPPAAAGAPLAPSPANQARYDLLDRAAEIAEEAIEANALELSAEFVERQRRIIGSIREATLAALKLAEGIGQAQEASDSVQRRPGNGSERLTALHNSALDFFHSAMHLIGATAGACSAAPEAGDPIRAGQTTVNASRPALTLRQRRVLGLLLGGLPNKLIAYELGVSEATVKAHVSQVLHKFHVHSRAQVIARLSRRIDLERPN
jgi:DNA-binding CsgD family transcriptional regulator